MEELFGPRVAKRMCSTATARVTTLNLKVETLKPTWTRELHVRFYMGIIQQEGALDMYSFLRELS